MRHRDKSLMLCKKMASKNLSKEFEKIVGKSNVLANEADRFAYSYDSAVLAPTVPKMAIRPTSEEELGKVVAFCAENSIPMTVRGAGTNLSGGTVPDSEDSVVILTQALNRILEINREDLYAVVQPGVVTARFAEAVAAEDLFYPPDPGSQAVSTLGGNIAENAGGLRGLKYGVTKDYLMGVEFFDAGGELIKSGSRTVKCVTGYNLCGLMAASEGTLGIISKAILKLVPPPRASRAMMAVFDDMRAAANAVAGIIAAHILPCTLEIMDNVTINLVEDNERIGLPRNAAAILLIEVDGHPAQVADDAETVEKVLKSNGSVQTVTARDAAEKSKLWEARRKALPALARRRPTIVLEDATVPRSKIPQMIDAIGAIAKKYDLLIGTFGHAGDGNLHPSILCDKRDANEFSRVEQAIDELFARAIEMGGTLSGEHGIGTAKAKWLERETNKATILFSQKMRRALDAKALLNPSKMTAISR